MNNSRRNFIKTSAALGVASMMAPYTLQASNLLAMPDKKLNILILGGTSFLGPHQIAYALERGHKISTFTRGKTLPKVHPEVFDKVERLIGDRENNLEALKNRKWDVVIDNSGRRTKWTKDTAELLKDNVGMYLYTSSISVYYPFTGDDFSEKRKLVTEIPKELEPGERGTYAYGVMKATSEMATIKAFGADRSIIVRPTLLVGPGDRTDRFPYWLARLEKGGNVIIPGSSSEVVQYIDIRDIAQWMIRLCEDKAAGIYNGSGPGFDMTTSAFVHGIHACYNSPVNFVHINDNAFLQQNGVIGIQPWVIQLPKYAGMSRSDNSKAIASGLTFRSLANTVEATKQWWYSDAVSQKRRDNILTSERSFAKREADIIAKWKQRKK